ncbi:glycosyltransferase family 4 protein [Alteromonas sp. BZK5]|uniref:glycosyltransferase family 4 protein n=1 Tax=Alteromonas sp. BZK5 TaxID=1904459 RepID=UPI001653BB59|nr:glycosyltransferase family 4 protein [Alteromonas sp. BZK5]MBC6986907.1 glycosyltransferase family 4 protein [Alteromonas sp. BZK5]
MADKSSSLERIGSIEHTPLTKISKERLIVNRHTIGFYPATNWHAYQKAMAQALEKNGFEVKVGHEFTDDALISSQESVVHFHWIERFWEGGTFFEQLKSLIGVWRFIKKAKRLGKVLVWTVHNHKPHGRVTWADWAGVRLFCFYSDIVACHSEWSKNWIENLVVTKAKVCIVYHGNFNNVFVPVTDNTQLKKKFGIEKGKICIGLVGEIRPSRGHELALEAIKNVNNSQLLIAGRCKDEAYLALLYERINAYGLSDRVKLVCKNLTDTEFNEYLAAADVSLLPYKDITTSGALLASWTVGTPVIASRLPYFVEMTKGRGSIGNVFDINSPSSLIGLLKKLSNGYTHEHWVMLRKRTLDEANQYDWDRVVLPLVLELKTRVNGLAEDKRNSLNG